MRLRTNFSLPFGRTAVFLAALGWGTALSAAAAGAWMVLDAFQAKREIPSLEEKLAALRGEPQDPAGRVEAPSEGEAGKLKSRLERLNLLKAGNGRASSTLLARLEGRLPERARLASLRYERRTGGLQLTVESGGQEDLSGFLADLEKDPLFGKVRLLQQSQPGKEDGGVVKSSLEMVENR